MEKLNIIYIPGIDDEEKKIFEEIFGKDKIIFSEYRAKGMTSGAFDIQIIIDTLNDPSVTALLHGTELLSMLTILVKKLFGRNTQKIMDNNSRPRYTTLSIRRKTHSIVISNVNTDNKVLISKLTSNFDGIKKGIEKNDDEYSDKKLKEFLEN